MNRYRILLADDEQIERMALAKRLVKHFGDSLAISEAVNGADALEVFKRERSQIVIMDISMPEMNGAEAAEHIRGMDEDCVIIFLTAYDDFAYAKRAIVIRALDYLLKPCDEDELVSVMEEAMRLTDRRALQKARESGLAAGTVPDGHIPVGQGGNVPGTREGGALGTQEGGALGIQEGFAPGTQKGFALGTQEGFVPGTQEGDAPGIPFGDAPGTAAGMGDGSGRSDTIPQGGHGLEDAGAARMAQAAETMREYIRNNYMKEISMQDAARVMNYSDAYFCKLFKQCFDQNFTSYLTNFRVNEAKKLLKNRNISVKDVGMQVGYYDSNYFAKVFKRITGMIPSEYRDSRTQH
ncbi:response regulator [Lachnoclostridium pacaense]|uniref:response regulator transcription factor n=1 Tax=Enterocloster hominis (ex Hitch et al. 2024) TaxID=1917870 RepID=UPI001D0F5DB6|nr:response regulator [Lachnoclostridium pacaense]MCC2815850.1 response regulator [Lachnoclostridium pacaense]